MVAKKGEKYKCSECGMVITVDKDCVCKVCNIMCCGKSLKKL